MSNEALSEVQLENEHFRVVKWTIPHGAVIPMHTHEYEYVVVPLVTASMTVVNDDASEFVAELVTGRSYTRPAGSRHQVENRAAQEPIVFIEVERLTES